MDSPVDSVPSPEVLQGFVENVAPDQSLLPAVGREQVSEDGDVT